MVQESDKDPVRRLESGARGRGARERPDDVTLVGAYRRGEGRAFEEVESWIRVELRRRYPGLNEEFDDLCQTVHEKLLTNLRADRFQGTSSLRTYVTSIAQHTAIDRLRELYRQRALTELPEARPGASVPPNPYGRVEQLDETRLLHQVLQTLPPHCRELWHLVFVERLPYDEIGTRLSIPAGTVKSRMWHCRQKAVALLRRFRGKLAGS